MATREDFLRAIVAEPDDDTHRLVFADWLDENDEGERAELIRIQCELERDVADGPRLAGLTRRERELLDAHLSKWVGPLKEGHSSAGYRRGMGFVRPHTSTFLTKQFQEEAAEWIPRAEVIEFSLNGETNRLDVLFGSPLLAHMTSLHLSWVQLQDRGIDELANCPHLSRLTDLGLQGSRITDKELRRLAKSPVLTHLRKLGLGDNHRISELSATGVRNVLESPAFSTVTSLEISPKQLIRSPSHFRALAECEGWQRLRKLTIGGSRFPLSLFGASARSLNLPNLSELALIGSELYRDEILALTEARNLVNLRRLNLGINDLSPDMARTLLDSAAWPGLTELNLYSTHLGDAGVKALAGSPTLARLTNLDLSKNDIGDEGLRALLESPHVSNLRVLNLGNNRIGEAGLLALAGSDALPELRFLSVHCCPGLNETTARALVETTCFSRLARLRVFGHQQHSFQAILREGFAGRVLLS